DRLPTAAGLEQAPRPRARSQGEGVCPAFHGTTVQAPGRAADGNRPARTGNAAAPGQPRVYLAAATRRPPVTNVSGAHSKKSRTAEFAEGRRENRRFELSLPSLRRSANSVVHFLSSSAGSAADASTGRTGSELRSIRVSTSVAGLD